MSEKNLSNKIVSGIKWKTIERISLQIINAVTPILLARMLTPDDFGVVAILSVFISLANTFVNNGLGNSIVQKTDSDNIDCSTVFYTQLAISIICYGVLYISAPAISDYYSNPLLTDMLRVMSFALIIGALGAMQNTILKKRMLFNRSFIATGTASVVYATVGIICAMNNMGCWSLVYANIAQSTALTVVNVLVIRWKPEFKYSFTRLKSLFSYSWKLTVGWLIGTLHQDIYALVIGKRFSSSMLGYYNRAGSIPVIFQKTITEVSDGVMFPALSTVQHNKDEFVKMSRSFLTTNAFIIFPVFFGLAAIAKPLTIVLLTEVWLPSVPMMRIVCITYALNTLNNSNMQIFNAIGRSDIFMKFEMFKRTLSIVLLIVMSYVNIYVVICVLLFMAVLSNLMNAWQNLRVTGYSYISQLRDIMPSVLLSAVMSVIVYVVGVTLEALGMNFILILILQVMTGGIVYLLGAYIFRFKALKNILTIVLKK